MEKKVTIKFHKALQKFTNGVKEHTLLSDSYISLYKSCLNLFPDLEKICKKIAVNSKRQELVFIVDGKILPLNNLYFPVSDKEVILCPVLGGSNSTTAAVIIAIVVIVVLVIINPGNIAFAPTITTSVGAGAVVGGGGLTFAGALAIGLAINLTIALATGAFLKNKSNSDSNDTENRRNNDAFDSLTNTASPRTPVPLNYGEIRTAGHLASGFVKTINHGKDDNILVESFFK